jgi:hypothetical protein
MFNKKYEDRLVLWREFRDGLELSKDPIQEAINFYQHAPTSLLAADPYEKSTWPDPWQLLEENNYCSFVKILAICYTLQLTDKFSQSNFEIHITRDNEKSRTYYLLYVDDIVIGFNEDTYVYKTELPNTLYSEIIHTMLSQQ